MLRVINNHTWCSPKTKAVTIIENKLFFMSSSNIVIADDEKIVDFIYIDGYLNCLNSGYGKLVCGDILGNGYVIDETKDS